MGYFWRGVIGASWETLMQLWMAFTSYQKNITTDG
jgi:hypothetical protein